MTGLLVDEQVLRGAALIDALFGVRQPTDSKDREGWRVYRKARKRLYVLIRRGAPVYREDGRGGYAADPEEFARWYRERYLKALKAAGAVGIGAPKRPGRPRRAAAA